MKYYTGIGSRKTPDIVLGQMFLIAADLAKKGYILRSGGASGADSAFEKGCDSMGGQKEIYLPWKNFNDNKSILFNVSIEALKLAESIHPSWGACSFGAKKLHGRNIYQVFGTGLDKPSNLVICWTLDGKIGGGTRTAIVLAQQNKIPVYNLATDGDCDKLIECLKLTT